MSNKEPSKESFKKRYTIIKRIAEGNFGCVYKALDVKTSIKFIKTCLQPLKSFLFLLEIQNKD